MSVGSDVVALVEPLRVRFEERHDARETGLAAARDAIRAAANAIRAIHRGEHARADALLADAHAHLEAGTEACAPFPEVRHAGFLTDAAKEVAEAELTRASLADDPLPTPTDVGVDDVAWLHGLAETVGELRRACLDRIRREELDDAERLLDVMQDILAALVSIDVPDGLTRGLRRVTDSARAITERTRGDLTASVGQRDLRRALDSHREALERTFRVD